MASGPSNQAQNAQALDVGTGVVFGLVARDPGSATLTTIIEGGRIRLQIDPALYSAVPQNEWAIQDTSKAFTASKDTYVYVSSAGALGYIEVANAATKPTLATLVATGGYGAQFIAKVVTDGSRVVAGGVTDLRQFAGSFALSAGTTASFVTASQGAVYWKAPQKVRILGAQATVTAALGATDTGTITLASGINDVYTNMTNGVITLAISATVGTRGACVPTTSHILGPGQAVRLTSAKTTTGGAAEVQILYEVISG